MMQMFFVGTHWTHPTFTLLLTIDVEHLVKNPYICPIKTTFN